MEQRPVDRRVRRTKKAIQDAVAALLQDQDFDKLTVTAVARQADIDRKTFYLHYRSIDEVVDEIIRQDIDQIVELWREELAKQGEGQDSTALLMNLCVVMVNDISYNGAVLRHMSSDMLLAKIEKPLIEAIIEEDALGLASLMGPNLGYGVSFFCSGLLAVVQRWLHGDDGMPMEDLVEMVCTMVAEGTQGLLRAGEPTAA